MTPGFEFRFRVDGGPPTVRSFPIGKPDSVTRGDLVDVVDGRAVAGAAGNGGFVGVVVETVPDKAGRTRVRAITDADAVYAVTDPSARAAGTVLNLAGATGAQSVTGTDEGDLVVLVDCTDDQSTLVRIAAGRHRAVADHEGRDLPLGAPLNKALCSAVGGLYHRHIGRGPTASQAFYFGQTVVVLLAGALTPAERSLADHGRRDAVLKARDALHQAMSADLIAAVEGLTGRTVTASMGVNHIAPDMSAELFVVDRPLPSLVAG
jgi:uncharacterized protein YbcI